MTNTREEAEDLIEGVLDSFPAGVKNSHRERMEIFMALDKAGLAIVPLNPTPEMRQLGGEVNCPTETLTIACDYAEEVYRAMVNVSQGKEPGYNRS